MSEYDGYERSSDGYGYSDFEDRCREQDAQRKRDLQVDYIAMIHDAQMLELQDIWERQQFNLNRDDDTLVDELLFPVCEWCGDSGVVCYPDPYDRYGNGEDHCSCPIGKAAAESVET